MSFAPLEYGVWQLVFRFLYLQSCRGYKFSITETMLISYAASSGHFSSATNIGTDAATSAVFSPRQLSLNSVSFLPGNKDGILRYIDKALKVG